MIKKTNTTKDTGQKIQFYHVILKASQQVGIHQQDTWELSYIIKGKGWRIVGDTEEPFKDGNIVLVPPCTTHCWEFEDNGNLIENITVIFSTELMQALADNFCDLREVTNRLILHQGSALMLHGKTRLEAAKILQHMCEEDAAMRTVSLIRLLVLISKSRELSEAGKENKETDAERRLREIKLFVVCNFQRELTIDDIAEHVGMNRSAACTFFKRNEGKTIWEYMNHLRLEEAKRLLSTTDFTIQEICYKSGFRDLAHFSRTFRKGVGTSPSEYRKYSDLQP